MRYLPRRARRLPHEQRFARVFFLYRLTRRCGRIENGRGGGVQSGDRVSTPCLASKHRAWLHHRHTTRTLSRVCVPPYSSGTMWSISRLFGWYGTSISSARQVGTEQCVAACRSFAANERVRSPLASRPRRRSRALRCEGLSCPSGIAHPIRPRRSRAAQLLLQPRVCLLRDRKSRSTPRALGWVAGPRARASGSAAGQADPTPWRKGTLAAPFRQLSTVRTGHALRSRSRYPKVRAAPRAATVVALGVSFRALIHRAQDSGWLQVLPCIGAAASPGIFRLRPAQGVIPAPVLPAPTGA